MSELQKPWGMIANSDLSREQRFVIERDPEGLWGIHDRGVDPEFSYYFVVQQIETREEAEELRGLLIRGEDYWWEQ